MDWIDFLKVMAAEEYAARDRYHWAAQNAENPQLQAVFVKLRDEEEFHAEFLEAERAKLEKLLETE